MEAFIGAVIGSGLTILAQWFLGPLVERRIRAQDRWEQFLIEFASLIDAQVGQAEEAAHKAWMSWRTAEQVALDADDRLDDRRRGLLEQHVTERREAYRAAHGGWTESMSRPDWLAQRITGDYEVADDELRRFMTRWMVYHFNRHNVPPWDERSHDESPWGDVADSRRKLLAAVEVLSKRIGVTAGPVQRLRARIRLRKERRRAAEREKRELEQSRSGQSAPGG